MSEILVKAFGLIVSLGLAYYLLIKDPWIKQARAYLYWMEKDYRLFDTTAREE